MTQQDEKSMGKADRLPHAFLALEIVVSVHKQLISDPELPDKN
jgi:hypothetical protein